MIGGAVYEPEPALASGLLAYILLPPQRDQYRPRARSSEAGYLFALCRALIVPVYRPL